jgi:hypothetical protein
VQTVFPSAGTLIPAVVNCFCPHAGIAVPIESKNITMIKQVRIMPAKIQYLIYNIGKLVLFIICNKQRPGSYHCGSCPVLLMGLLSTRD